MALNALYSYFIRLSIPFVLFSLDWRCNIFSSFCLSVRVFLSFLAQHEMGWALSVFFLYDKPSQHMCHLIFLNSFFPYSKPPSSTVTTGGPCFFASVSSASLSFSMYAFFVSHCLIYSCRDFLLSIYLCYIRHEPYSHLFDTTTCKHRKHTRKDHLCCSSFVVASHNGILLTLFFLFSRFASR